MKIIIMTIKPYHLHNIRKSGSHGQIKVSPYERPDLIEKSYVSMDESINYSNGKKLYFWDINNMVDYCSTKGCRIRNIHEFGLKRVPQSWQYI